MKKKSSLYPLLFGIAFVIIALFSQSWELSVFGGIFVIIGVLLIVHDIRTSIAQKKNNTKENMESIHSDEQPRKVKFREFGFWVESLFQVNALLEYMQQAIEIASEQGYSIGEVNVFGGVHELDTCYEAFSAHKYTSFEEAKKQLPIDFEKEEAALDGHGFTTVNFEFFTVEVKKDGVSSNICFSRGELTAVDELYEIYLNTEWKKH